MQIAEPDYRAVAKVRAEFESAMARAMDAAAECSNARRRIEAAREELKSATSALAIVEEREAAAMAQLRTARENLASVTEKPPRPLGPVLERRMLSAPAISPDRHVVAVAR
jgi:chromosome segregation ATPase